MKTENRYTVKEVKKFGLLFGYVVFDNKEKKSLPYEFADNEKEQAETKAELKNAFNA